MLIDWFTVGAQIVNFIILVWLLKRFLYQPILNAIDAREKKVKSQIEEAQTRKEEAERERDEFRRKNEEFENERGTMLSEAKGEAKKQRRALLEEAREEAEALRNRLEKAVREEKEDLYREVVERTQREVFALARKVLQDLSSQQLEEHMARAFLRRLKDLVGDQRERLTAALGETPDGVVIKSAFELPDVQREEIESTLEKVAPAEIDCRFITDPGKIGGIELTAGGYKVAWSVDDYLDTLEKKVNELLARNGAAPAAASQKATSNESS